MSHDQYQDTTGLTLMPPAHDPRDYLGDVHPAPAEDQPGPAGMAATIALQTVAELARGLQVLRSEVRMYAKPGRREQEALGVTLYRLDKVAQVLDKALPIALAPPRAYVGQVADSIAEQFTPERAREVGFGDPHDVVADVVDFIRHLLDDPTPDV